MTYFQKSLLLITFLLTSSVVASQNAVEIEALFEKNINSVYKNTEQTSRVASYLLSNAETPQQKAKSYYLQAMVDFLEGDDLEGLEMLLLSKEQFESEEKTFFYTLLVTTVAERYYLAGMTESALSYLDKAENLALQLPKDEKEIILQKSQLLRVRSLTSTTELEVLPSLKDDVSLITIKNPALIAKLKNEKGFLFIVDNKLDSARFYFNKSLSILKANDLKNSALAATSQEGLGSIDFLKSNFDTSLQHFLAGLENDVILPETRYSIQNHLATIYRLRDNVDESTVYESKNTLLKANILEKERASRSLLIADLEKGQNASIEEDMNTYYILGAAIFILLLLILISYYFYNKKLNNEYRQFEKIIKQLENKEKLELAASKLEEATLNESKGVVIPKSTEDAILERLDAFERSSDFTSPNMSLTVLAKQIKTNTKYISEIIRTHKNKNFNTYINELRINYIIHMMQEDPQYLKYKVSYLAEKSGFSSHSSFTVVFKSITDITPKQFIVFLKKSNKVAS